MTTPLLTLAAMLLFAPAQEFWRALYYVPASIPVQALPWSKYTHVIAYGLLARPDCGLDDTTYHLSAVESQFIAGAHSRAVHAMISLLDAHGTLRSCTEPSRVDAFAVALARYVTSRKYDGLDIDWERDVSDLNYGHLIRKLRSVLPSSKALTSTTSYSNRRVMAGRHADLDRIFVMNYDSDMWYSPSGNPASAAVPNSTLLQGGTAWRSADEEYQYYAASSGIPPGKLVLGIPFYGRVIQGCLSGYGKNGNCSRGVTRPGQTFATCCAGTNGNLRKSIPYNAIASSPYARGTYVWDSTHQIEYYEYHGDPRQNAFVSFTGPRQVAAAVEWAHANGYGGVFGYEAGFEYVESAAGDERWPLSTALYAAALRQSEPASALTLPRVSPQRAPCDSRVVHK